MMGSFMMRSFMMRSLTATPYSKSCPPGSANRCSLAMAAWPICAVMLVACGSSELASSAGSRDAGETGLDSGTADAASDASITADGSTADTATVMGTVQRNVTPPAGSGDGRGDVYVALFDQSPFETENATSIAAVRVGDVDLSDPAQTVRYQIDDVPRRAEPYAVGAFLDDDLSVLGSDEIEPSAGDSIAFERILTMELPTVDVSEAQTVELNLTLNAVLPGRARE